MISTTTTEPSGIAIGPSGNSSPLAISRAWSFWRFMSGSCR